MKLFNMVMLAAAAGDVVGNGAKPPQRSAADARKLSREIKAEMALTSKDIQISETLAAFAVQEAEAYLKDFKAAEPGLIKAEELNKSLSVHCLEVGRKAYTLGRIGHKRVLYFDKLCGIVEQRIISATGAPSKDATNNALSTSAMLAWSRAGSSWKTYKSTVRQALTTKDENEKFIDLMEKDHGGNFLIANSQDAGNRVREIRNRKQAANQGTGTTDDGTDEDVEKDTGGMLDRDPKTSELWQRLKSEVTGEWPANLRPETVAAIQRTLTACLNQVQRLKQEAEEMQAKAPATAEPIRASVRTEHEDGSATVVEDDGAESHELPGVVEDGSEAPSANANG